MNTQPTFLRCPHSSGRGAQGFAARKNPLRNGFTLIELLVVIAIIGVLAALLFPGYKLVMKKAQGSKCASNLRQVFIALEGYSQDNQGESLPTSRWTTGNSDTDFWFWKLRPYVGASNEYDDKIDNKVGCPTYKSVSGNWAPWGYGMNSKPGLEGTASSSDNGYNRRTPAPPRPQDSWIHTFQSINITHKSKRLWIVDAKEWQVTPAGTAAGVASFPDYNRHGTGACNALFFDGHVETLKSAAINQALFDPGKK